MVKYYLSGADSTTSTFTNLIPIPGNPATDTEDNVINVDMKIPKFWIDHTFAILYEGGTIDEQTLCSRNNILENIQLSDTLYANARDILTGNSVGHSLGLDIPVNDPLRLKDLSNIMTLNSIATNDALINSAKTIAIDTFKRKVIGDDIIESTKPITTGKAHQIDITLQEVKDCQISESARIAFSEKLAKHMAKYLDASFAGSVTAGTGYTNPTIAPQPKGGSLDAALFDNTDKLIGELMNQAAEQTPNRVNQLLGAASSTGSHKPELIDGDKKFHFLHFEIGDQLTFKNTVTVGSNPDKIVDNIVVPGTAVTPLIVNFNLTVTKDTDIILDSHKILGDTISGAFSDEDAGYEIDTAATDLIASLSYAYSLGVVSNLATFELEIGENPSQEAGTAIAMAMGKRSIAQLKLTEYITLTAAIAPPDQWQTDATLTLVFNGPDDSSASDIISQTFAAYTEINVGIVEPLLGSGVGSLDSSEFTINVVENIVQLILVLKPYHIVLYDPAGGSTNGDAKWINDFANLLIKTIQPGADSSPTHPIDAASDLYIVSAIALRNSDLTQNMVGEFQLPESPTPAQVAAYNSYEGYRNALKNMLAEYMTVTAPSTTDGSTILNVLFNAPSDSDIGGTLVPGISGFINDQGGTPPANMVEMVMGLNIGSLLTFEMYPDVEQNNIGFVLSLNSAGNMVGTMPPLPLYDSGGGEINGDDKWSNIIADFIISIGVSTDSPSGGSGGSDELEIYKNLISNFAYTNLYTKVIRSADGADGAETSISLKRLQFDFMLPPSAMIVMNQDMSDEWRALRLAEENNIFDAVMYSFTERIRRNGLTKDVISSMFQSSNPDILGSTIVDASFSFVPAPVFDDGSILAPANQTQSSIMLTLGVREEAYVDGHEENIKFNSRWWREAYAPVLKLHGPRKTFDSNFILPSVAVTTDVLSASAVSPQPLVTVNVAYTLLLPAKIIPWGERAAPFPISSDYTYLMMAFGYGNDASNPTNEEIAAWMEISSSTVISASSSINVSYNTESTIFELGVTLDDSALAGGASLKDSTREALRLNFSNYIANGFDEYKKLRVVTNYTYTIHSSISFDTHEATRVIEPDFDADMVNFVNSSGGTMHPDTGAFMMHPWFVSLDYNAQEDNIHSQEANKFFPNSVADLGYNEESTVTCNLVASLLQRPLGSVYKVQFSSKLIDNPDGSGSHTRRISVFVVLNDIPIPSESELQATVDSIQLDVQSAADDLQAANNGTYTGPQATLPAELLITMLNSILYSKTASLAAAQLELTNGPKISSSITQPWKYTYAEWISSLIHNSNPDTFSTGLEYWNMITKVGASYTTQKLNSPPYFPELFNLSIFRDRYRAAIDIGGSITKSELKLDNEEIGIGLIKIPIGTTIEPDNELRFWLLEIKMAAAVPEIIVHRPDGTSGTSIVGGDFFIDIVQAREIFETKLSYPSSHVDHIGPDSVFGIWSNLYQELNYSGTRALHGNGRSATEIILDYMVLLP